MLSLHQYKIVSELLEHENIDEILETLILRYATTVERTGKLLNLIPKLAENQLEIKQKAVNQYSWSVDLLLGDRLMHPPKYKKSEDTNRFCVLLYTCRIHFKSGNVDGQSEACKKFFSEFIEALKNRIGFDYTSKEDWKWVSSTADCSEWLESVIKQNIDSSFECNKYLEL